MVDHDVVTFVGVVVCIGALTWLGIGGTSLYFLYMTYSGKSVMWGMAGLCGLYLDYKVYDMYRKG